MPSKVCIQCIQNNAFKSLIKIHDIKGAAEWSSFCDNQFGRVSGITEHLQSYASSGQNVVITTSTSKRGSPVGPSKSCKRSFFLPGQRAKYEEKRNKDIGINKLEKSVREYRNIIERICLYYL